MDSTLFRRTFSRTVILAGGALLAFVHPRAPAQGVMLDPFDSLAGWRTIVADGAALSLGLEKGAEGNALAMRFDLRGTSGYVIAEKDFPLDLPPDYQFTFDMRAEAPVNNFEFKVIDDRDNVYWVKKLNVVYPREWTLQRIRRRHLAFAWGPAPGKPLTTVRKIQFVVSCGTGGTGTVLLDNFRFIPAAEGAGKNAAAGIVGPPGGGRIDAGGTLLEHWRSPSGAERDSLVVDFHRVKEVGGLVVDWDSSDYALAYDVLLSDDGAHWSRAYSVATGKPGRAYVPLGDGEGTAVKLLCTASSRHRGYAIGRLEFRTSEFSASPNALFRAIAADAPAGSYPKYLGNRQSYWTVVGVDGDTKEALLNEQGMVEVEKLQFSIEPFLVLGGSLVTWNDVRTEQWLYDGQVPFPSTTWHCGSDIQLNVQAAAVGVPGNSLLLLHYAVYSAQGGLKGKLFLAFRPFQVVPPWQQLNAEGGVGRIDSIAFRQGIVHVNQTHVVPLTSPEGFGASPFDRGDITGFLRGGKLPEAQAVVDPAGFASGALAYDVTITGRETADFILAVPFHPASRVPPPHMSGEDATLYYDLATKTQASGWLQKLGTFRMDLPPAGRAVAATLRSTLAYILINRDGPAIQPGSRTYKRSWIRDGALTCAGLLRIGHMKEVRDFLDWYAGYQFPDGRIPCVVDARGADPMPEHDSNGEFIYAVCQYYQFTKDTAWLRGIFPHVTRAVGFLQSLRAQRKTEAYRNGTPEQRAEYGILPQSISHEGYWDVPRHSYWDDFFALRGLKDAVTIAGVLGDTARVREYAAERDDFRGDLYASMRLAMSTRHVDYIPGCAELGDFDATSTTIGVQPGGELGNIPEPQLHNTFDRYYRYFRERKANDSITSYTPYETRVIGTMVMLGQKERAEEALNFFMNDRRPAAWNQWAEVVWRDPATPKYIGDMPHTWVASDFLRSVLTMFLYERERDGAVVLAAGIPDAWIRDTAGVRVADLRTYDGTLGYSLRKSGDVVTAEVAGTLAPGHRPVVISSPLSGRLRAVVVNGSRIPLPRSGEVRLETLPATVKFTYVRGGR